MCRSLLSSGDSLRSARSRLSKSEAAPHLEDAVPDDLEATASELALARETLQVGLRKAVWAAICDAGEQVGIRIAGQQAHTMADIALRRLTQDFEFNWRRDSNLPAAP